MTEIRMCNRCRSNVLNENDLKACTRCKDIFKQKRLNNIDEIKLQSKERYQTNKEVNIERHLLHTLISAIIYILNISLNVFHSPPSRLLQ